MKQNVTSGFLRGSVLLSVLTFFCLTFCSPNARGQTWTIGTATTTYGTSGTPISPLGYYYPQIRVNYLYDTAAMRAAGMPVGGGAIPIHQIAFNVGTLQGATKARNYTIGILGTTVTTLPTGGFIGGTGGLPIYYNSPSGYQPSTGWNTITLSSPFMWNGTDNIVIEMCWSDGTAYGPAQAGVQFHTTPSGVKSTYAYGTATAFCGNPPGPTSNTPNRPNIRFSRLYPCTGASAVPATTPTGLTNSICPGFSTTIVATGYTNALNTKFQWWTSSTSTGPWVLATGDSASDKYTTPPLITNTYYRLTVTCLNTGDSVVTSVVGFTPTGGFPVYASLPYFESFENWGNGCAIQDKVASNNWTNIPITGDGSWRREDSFASAGWYSPTTYAPAKAIDGLHCARHHSYVSTIVGNEGSLSLYFNASATTGNKDISFYYRFNYGAATNYDSLNVELSTDGGNTFTYLYKLGNASGPYQTWNFLKTNVAVTSATCVLRFRARALVTGHDDIYIDAVRIDPPCTGKPEAGIVDSTVLACSGTAFQLGLLGDDQTAGLAYLWQTRKPGTVNWSPLAGGNVRKPMATITSATEFRCIVTCTYSTPNMADTTPVYRVNLAPFYYCYCGSTSVPPYSGYGYSEVGNVTIQTQPALSVLMSNGNATPSLNNPGATFTGYQDFRRTVAPPTLIRDSTYRISISQISGNNSWATASGIAFLDINRDGVFQSPGEMIINRSIASSSSPTAAANFIIPTIAPAGLTGLRVYVYYSPPNPVNPCGNLQYYGQVEDYLVRLEYSPCVGPVNPGTARISDTAVCPGYTVDLYDTSYERTRTNINRMWERSTNGGASYSAIPGSAQKDTMANVIVTAATYYRLRVICGPTGDTTYSNTVFVNTPEPVRCYPTSWAFPGGGTDTSDIGTFLLGESFVNPPAGVPSGPHLLNPAAHSRRGDFTLLPPTELKADSTYRIAIFHTMPGAYHSNALISVYMDFNHDGDYDLNVPPPPFTSELIFQGISRFDSFFLDTKITIPSAVIPNIPTGLRVVLNNDTNPFGPGNTGSGNFVSGEVEDYVVIFRRTPVNVPGAALVQNVAMFPNPTSGKFTVTADAIHPINHLDVTITSMTGQRVLTQSYDRVGTRFSTEFSLDDQAKGVYFVELRADGEKITKKLVVR